MEDEFGIDLSQYSDDDLEQLENMYGGVSGFGPNGETEFEQPEFAGEGMESGLPNVMSLPPELMGKLSSEDLENYTSSMIKISQIQGEVMAHAFHSELTKLVEGHTKVASSEQDIHSELYNALRIMIAED